MLKYFINLLLIFTVGYYSRAESVRTYYDSLVNLSNACHMLPLPACQRYIAVEARAALDKLYNSDGTHQAYWGFTWREKADVYTVKLQPGTSDRYSLAEERYIAISMLRNDTVIETQSLTHGIARHNGANTLVIEFTDDSRCKVYAGNKELQPMMDIAIKSMPSDMGIVTNRNINIDYLMVETEADVRASLVTGITFDDIMNQMKGETAGPEGIWRYLDRENDSRYARPGGEYRLAVMGNDTGGYDIIYLTGARVGATQWETGMLKGRLMPTIFENQYDLWWVDSQFQPIAHDIHARMEQDAILILEFPLLHTVMRFSREPTGK